VPAPSDVTSALLQTAWGALGARADLLDSVVVDGEDEGLLPSRLAALPAMLAAVACSTLAASTLDAARRGGTPRAVSLDAGHVALAARSERYARDGMADRADRPTLFAPLSRFWRTSDGWLRLHANYDWHRERALGVLGCTQDQVAVERAIGAWRGEELEAALMAAGALGFAVRSPQQWRAHPQGRAVEALGLVETVIGTGATRPPLPAARLATGRRVLDLTRVIAGPVATRTLAAWGAEVLRVDSPRLPEIPAQALDVLPGKRSALLDLAKPAERQRIEELLAEADVLVYGYRPRALDRYGLSTAAIWERHPHLSIVTVSAWGGDGPWAGERGFDSLVQCPTGIAVLEGSEQQPGALPAQVLDHATGYLGAAAALLALAAGELGEPPRLIRLSLAQTARWLMGAGARERKRELSVDAQRHMVSLPGARRPVRVIAPPGRAGELAPGWSATTELGADAATFSAREPGSDSSSRA
jgi:hypothetical protein